jgi:HEPN domain-containing protein
MNRYDFQQIARMRLKEARILLKNNCFEGAYYLAGYAVECALKACIAKKVKRYDFPDKTFTNKIYTHEMQKLIDAAGLELQLRQLTGQNNNFSLNWSIVKDWSEEKRYSTNISKAVARDLYIAITGKNDGIITWLKTIW